MHMSNLTRADVTPEAIWMNRRQIIAAMGAGSIAGGIGFGARAQNALEPHSWE